MPSAFLTARWEQLLMLNWAVPPALLAERVPSGTQQDTQDGRCWVSLVAFMFRDTRVKGIAVPFHIDFEEVNLRMYVRRDVPDEGRGCPHRRGVVFVRELVPRAAIAWVAREVYGEAYRSTRMWHRRAFSGTPVDAAAPLAEGQQLVYGWSTDNGDIEVAARVHGPATPLEPGSHAEFIAEHYWGYAAQRDGSTIEYEVTHPPWSVHAVDGVTIRGDLAWEYGGDLARALDRPPDSAFLAVGSEVAVLDGARLS